MPRETYNDKPYKGYLLMDDLATLGIDPTTLVIHTANDDEQIPNLMIEFEEADRAVIEQAIADHDATQLSIAEKQENVSTSAKTQLRNIPNWATWDEEASLAWYDANVVDEITNISTIASTKILLAQMATVQRNIIRMNIALRNKLFPDLQE